jgi:diguanylate cyclase (GGDEF)-like protein
MISQTNANQLSLQELRELVPQLQEITKRYERSEFIQKSLFDISELASSINELSSLYPAIHDIVGDLMPAQNFFVVFYEEEKDAIDFVYFVDEFDEQIVSSVDDLKNSITGYILRTGKHLFLTQETYQQQLTNISVKDLGADPVDWIGIPLKHGSQVIGAIVVQSYDESVRYNQEDLEILLFVSQHIVNCVDRVKSRELTEKTIRQRTKQLREINDELQQEISERQKIESLQQALFEISELSASVEGDMDDFYVAVHGTLSRLIGAPNCYVATIDGDNKTLQFPYYKDEVQSQIKPQPMGLGLTEYVIRHCSAELIDATRAHNLSDAKELSLKVARSMFQKMSSWIGSPLIINGEICGVIAVQGYGKEKQYNLKDLEFLRFVSHHVALVLGRKQSSDAIKAYNQRLEKDVKEQTEKLNRTNLFLQKQIEERLQAQRQLEHDAQHDSLTGLANRVLFNSRLELALASKQRYLESNFAIIFIDLDRFKHINDSLGHIAGDHVLKEVAIRIRACIRGHDLLARLGGDEFVVLFDNYDSPNDVEEISARIISTISNPFSIKNKDMYLGASIGIAYIEGDYKTADEVLRDADAAMYQAKFLGRGRYIVFNKTMRDKLLEEFEIESEFRKLLKTNAFEIYSQPVINLTTQEQIYQECYVRWEHPSIGKIKRDQYCQIAEQCGLTVEMDKFMLTKACEILQNSQFNKVESNKRIAINLSIHHLTQTTLAKQLIEHLEDAGVDPKNLIIEFDENALNRQTQFFLPAIKILKQAGIALVLDNFGSGLASLNYLYYYPFDFVKIDHYFVKTLPRSERNLKLIRSVLSISDHLKFGLIASGINTQEQHQALLDAGCRLGQGKLLQKSAKIAFTQVKI